MLNMREFFGKISHILAIAVVAFAFFGIDSRAANAACAANEIDVLGNGSQCEESKLEITTTSDTTQFKFALGAKGTFYVDWGDGNKQTISRSWTSSAVYSHTYSTAGSYTIRMGGVATQYETGQTRTTILFYMSSSGGTPDKIASVSGSFSAIFPKLGDTDDLIPSFYQTFYNATNMTSFSATFDGLSGRQYMFYQTFYQCAGLTSLPNGMFNNVTTSAPYMFNETFYGCSGLTGLPDNLFSGLTTGADHMFYQTFYDCSGLTSLPNGLFSNITTGASYMFYQTFYRCTGLTSLPENLFSGIATAANYMFYGTFMLCSNLSGNIPPSTFAGLVNAGSPTASNMWTDSSSSSSIFYNTNLYTSCAPGTKQYVTGYEGGWADHVSCEPVTCAAGDLVVGGVDGCVTPKFEITTTSDTTEFKFSFGNSSGKFYVDWGDGSSIQSGASGLFSHTYASADSYTIKIAGTATGYSNIADSASISFYYYGSGTPDKIASVSGSLSALLPELESGSITCPNFYQTFWGATNLTSIPDTLFDGLECARPNMFKYAFYGCTSLADLPDGLFSSFTAGANNMFEQTFYGCTALTELPSDLFENLTTGEYSMFKGTFQGCTGLTNISPELFSSFSTGAQYMFGNTFSSCTSLTSLPNGLFSNITTGANNMFDHTFANSSHLSGYIPMDFFAGLSGKDYTSFMSSIFANTGLDTSCPRGMHQYITGFESYWDSKVSCAPGCADGLTLYNGDCHEMCSAATALNAGTYSYPLFADRTSVPSPVLNIKRGNTVCYVYLEPDVGGEHGLKFLYNNSVYHAVDPR